MVEEQLDGTGEEASEENKTGTDFFVGGIRLKLWVKSQLAER